jgi:hypothetical protein
MGDRQDRDRDAAPIAPEDQALLDRLRTLTERLDPVPEDVVAAARAAWAERPRDR